MMYESYKESTIEALILSSPEPLPGRKIAGMLDECTPGQVSKMVAQLNDGYSEKNSSFRIRQLAGGYQFYVLPEYSGLVEEMFTSRRRLRLSQAALETVAIVAYRQPVTKSEVEHIRGVASDGVLKTLMEKNLITITGRSTAVGKPLQYGSTDEFLKFFGLAKLEDLPSMAEIEELVAATEAKNQTELQLEVDADGRPLKLNIADGTFDPEQREQREDEYREGVDADKSVDSGETVETDNTVEDQTVSLTLKRTSAEIEIAEEPTDEAETVEEPAVEEELSTVESQVTTETTDNTD